jgi:hypothetical protein
MESKMESKVESEVESEMESEVEFKASVWFGKGATGIIVWAGVVLHWDNGCRRSYGSYL